MRKGEGGEREKESMCVCAPTSLVSPFLALPPCFSDQPSHLLQAGVCVCVFVCTLASVRAQEDKLVAGLLSPFPRL